MNDEKPHESPAAPWPSTGLGCGDEDVEQEDRLIGIHDESPKRHWWTRIPNIVLEKLPNPWEFKLYFTLKKIAGEEGECWYTTEHLAKIAGMSVGSVVKYRQELERKGLIKCLLRKPINQRTGEPSRGRPCYHSTIVDIWDENEARWREIRSEGISSRDEEKAGVSSPREGLSSPDEGYRSPDEATKNLRKKNREEDIDDVEENLKVLRDFGLNDPPLTEIATSRSTAWVEAAIQGVDSPGGVVHRHRENWQPSDKGRRTKEDRYRYFKGKYADCIEY